MLPSSAAYIFAIAPALVLPPAGMSAASMSGRFPSSAVGISVIGPALNIGRSAGMSANGSGASGSLGASSRTASRPCSDSGMPNHN